MNNVKDSTVFSLVLCNILVVALVRMSIGSGLVSLRPFTSIILMAKCISVPYKIEFAQDWKFIKPSLILI